MANGNKAERLLEKAMDVIFRYGTKHILKVSGKACPCTICHDANLLFDEFYQHMRKEVNRKRK
jgi:hypothetical protein